MTRPPALPSLVTKQGTGVDVFCASSEGLGAAALQGLVAPTSGYVVIQPSFGLEFAGNLAKSISEQAMSDGDGLHGGFKRERE